MCNETEDVRAQDGRGKAVAGDCWGWATLRDGSHGEAVLGPFPRLCSWPIAFYMDS